MLYSAYYFSRSAKSLTTLGLAEQLNYGLNMPPGWLRREMGDAEALCGSWQSCSSSQRAHGPGLIVDRQDAKQSPCSLLALQTAGNFTWTASLSSISQ